MHIFFVATVVLIVIFLIFMRKKQHPAITTIGSQFEREISNKDFEKMVLEKSYDVPVLVNFYARWCPPCQYLTPLLAELAEEYGGAFLLAKIDVDKNRDLTNEYGVSSYPTVALFKQGKSVEAFSGGKLEHSVRFKLAQHDVHSPNRDVK